MPYLVIHDSGLGLFVYPADSLADAEQYRVDCGNNGEATSMPVHFTDEIDFTALEQALEFIEAVRALPAAPPISGRLPADPLAAFAALGHHIDEIVAAIPRFSAREVIQSPGHGRPIPRENATSIPPTVIADGANPRFQQANERIIEFDHPLAAGLIGLRPTDHGELVIEVYATTGTVCVRHDPPRQRTPAADPALYQQKHTDEHGQH